MATLTTSTIATLLAPYYPAPTPLILDQLSTYLDLLLKWNARTNLTAIRDPHEIVKLHFGESLFVARHLPSAETLLDLGSGAGFPGLPIQMALPHLRVTLAESQTKKSTFLREVVRTLSLSTEVWAARVETLPPARRFDVVTLRAVDDPALALQLAKTRVSAHGVIAHLTAASAAPSILLPNSTNRVLELIQQ
jgi:16S rRNA (guanine527-N7)-methyltransferase